MILERAEENEIFEAVENVVHRASVALSSLP